VQKGSFFPAATSSDLQQMKDARRHSRSPALLSLFVSAAPLYLGDARSIFELSIKILSFACIKKRTPHTSQEYNLEALLDRGRSSRGWDFIPAPAPIERGINDQLFLKQYISMPATTQGTGSAAAHA
jgi:hypothetical protein